MTIVGKDGTYPLSINRRITEIIALNGAFTIQGDIVVETGSGSSSINSNGIFRRLTTLAVNNDFIQVSGTPMYNRQKEPSFYCRFKLNQTTNQRMFLGLTDQTSSSTISNAPLAGNYAGLYINTSTSSTFRSCRAGGGAFSSTSLGISIDTNYHDLYIWLKKSGGGNSMILQLDSNDRVEYTTTIPTTVSIMKYALLFATAAATAKSIEIAKCSINTEI